MRKQATPETHIADGEIHIDVSSYFRWKWIAERALAAVLLVAALPIMAVLAVIVRFSSRGPAVFHQVRVGRDGRLFTMYKYRTMMHGAEAKTGPIWALTDDPRLTRVGRIIRKMHLDELPQLWNVVRGDMGLVGPRPERPEFTHSLAKEIPGYSNRLAVLPGITGLAQINLPADSDLDSVRRKLVLDLEYVRHATMSIDVRLLLCTCFRAIGFSGYQASRLLSVRREVHMPEKPADVAPQVAEPVVANSQRQHGNGHSHVGELATATHRPR
ncbi:MAG: sugar transferase [Pirellulales bacterium]